MTDISRKALEIADEQIGDLTNIYHRYENMRAIAFALRDALDEAHRAGWDDAIEAAVRIVLGHTPSIPEGGPVGETAAFADDLMGSVLAAVEALPYKPQEDVSDG